MENPDAILCRGGSLIVSPLGEILARPAFDGETVLVADLDLGEILRGKYDFDVVGHYARPDIFRLYVNESPKPAVVFTSGASAESTLREAPRTELTEAMQADRRS